MELLENGLKKEFWQKVRTDEFFDGYRKDMLYLWETYCLGEIPTMSYKKFKQYGTTGERSTYERGYYFPRRLALCASAILSLIYPENEGYIERAQEEIFAICDEYSWALPAHIDGLLQEVNSCTIDLFSCETGFALAEIYHLLSDRLDPLIRGRMICEIDRRIIKPFLSGEEYKWQRYKNNWNAVCCGAIGCTFMLMCSDLFPIIKERLDRGMEIYLSSFNGDGICSEGLGYWNYGFGFFTVYADMLRRFTDGKEDYFKREDVRLAATFINKVHISGRCAITFADAGGYSYHGGTVDYLCREYPEEHIFPNPAGRLNCDGCGRFSMLLRSAIWADRERVESGSREATYFAPTSQMLIYRGARYGFAIKGGHNDEAHNHNDLGHFIFATGERQILADAGSNIYRKGYFDRTTRYHFVNCCSRGHSVPIIDGKYQMCGEEYASKDTAFEDGVFSTDISGAYGLPELKSLVRRAELLPDGVCIADTFDYQGEGEIIERLISVIEPRIVEGKGIDIDGCPITYEPAECKVKISSERIFDGGPTIYMIDLTLPEGERRFLMKVRVKQ